VFGPNGAGKSLLAELIRGRLRESRSHVHYAAGFDPARDILTVSFEEQQRLWRRDERLDVSDFQADAQDQGTTLAALIRAARTIAEQDGRLFDALVAELGLGGLLEQGIRFLSSGQIRRGLIARALYGQQQGRQRLLIFDEPLEAVDRDSRERLQSVIAAHLGQNCASLHLCRRAQDRFPGATHLLVMERLRAVSQGPMDEAAFAQAAQAFRRRHAIPSRLPMPPAMQRPSADSGGDGKKDAGIGGIGEIEGKSSPLIKLRGVNAGYGDLQVLCDVHWVMEAWHHVLIEGPNGCGKSTLLGLIDGENHLGYGEQVYLFGRRKGSGETVWDIKRRFGVVSNELHNRYVKGWRVLDVVVSGFFDSVGLYDDSGGSEHEHARAWLETLCAGHLAADFYHHLSFGEQRLVLLARAMVKQPDILVLDEPCVGLDDFHRDFILGTLELIAAQAPTRLIYVSHAAGEQPGCINQRLRFVADPGGGFRIEQSRL